MLRTKDMINKHLDDLEMFLGVFEACSNSSNLQMAGGVHIYRSPSGESRWEPLPNFSAWRRIDRQWGTGSSGHMRPEIAVGSSDS